MKISDDLLRRAMKALDNNTARQIADDARRSTLRKRLADPKKMRLQKLRLKKLPKNNMKKTTEMNIRRLDQDLQELGETISRSRQKDGYWAKQKGIVRAATDESVTGRGYDGKKGGNKYAGVANKSLIKKRLKGGMSGLAIGGAGGAAVGAGLAIASRGRVSAKGASIFGGAVGGSVGNSVGTYKADQKYFRKKGIKISRGGLKVDYSPKARKKYLRP